VLGCEKSRPAVVADAAHTGTAVPVTASVPAASPENQALLEDALDSLDLNELESYKIQVDNEIAAYTDHKSAKEWLLDFIRGGGSSIPAICWKESSVIWRMSCWPTQAFWPN
jgi:hypothetical protein